MHRPNVLSKSWCSPRLADMVLSIGIPMSRQSFFSTCAVDAVVMIVATTSLCLYNTGDRESK